MNSMDEIFLKGISVTFLERKPLLTKSLFSVTMTPQLPEDQLFKTFSGAEKVIQEAKNMPNVTYLGEINELEKVLLIKASYINIILSRLEALGLTQMEFMYNGVPVITSAVGGQKWLIHDGVEGLHVSGPEDIDGAALAVRKLVDDPGLWKSFSQNAKKRAMGYAISNLTADLDQALTAELIKESGLIGIPIEARCTFSAPENVLKSWSSGSWGVIVTEKRLFVKRGFLSRKVTEIPFKNISSIEFMRRYSWKTLVLGAAISVFLFSLPFFNHIFSRSFMASLDEFVRFILPQVFLQSPLLGTVINFLSLLPFLISVVIFAVQARTGFTLRGPGIEALYLPRRFLDAIALIRSVYDGNSSKKELGIDTKEEPTEKAAPN